MLSIARESESDRFGGHSDIDVSADILVEPCSSLSLALTILSQLTPFVAETVQRTRTTDAGQPEVYPKRFTGEDYLRAWKMAGGHDIIEETSAVESKGTNMPTPFEEKR
jgi:hypothetical protein